MARRSSVALLLVAAALCSVGCTAQVYSQRVALKCEETYDSVTFQNGASITLPAFHTGLCRIALTNVRVSGGNVTFAGGTDATDIHVALDGVELHSADAMVVIGDYFMLNTQRSSLTIERVDRHVGTRPAVFGGKGVLSHGAALSFKLDRVYVLPLPSAASVLGFYELCSGSTHSRLEAARHVGVVVDDHTSGVWSGVDQNARNALSTFLALGRKCNYCHCHVHHVAMNGSFHSMMYRSNHSTAVIEELDSCVQSMRYTIYGSFNSSATLRRSAHLGKLCFTDAGEDAKYASLEVSDIASGEFAVWRFGSGGLRLQQTIRNVSNCVNCFVSMSPNAFECSIAIDDLRNITSSFTAFMPNAWRTNITISNMAGLSDNCFSAGADTMSKEVSAVFCGIGLPTGFNCDTSTAAIAMDSTFRMTTAIISNISHASNSFVRFGGKATSSHITVRNVSHATAGSFNQLLAGGGFVNRCAVSDIVYQFLLLATSNTQLPCTLSGPSTLVIEDVADAGADTFLWAGAYSSSCSVSIARSPSVKPGGLCYQANLRVASSVYMYWATPKVTMFPTPPTGPSAVSLDAVPTYFAGQSKNVALTLRDVCHGSMPFDAGALFVNAVGATLTIDGSACAVLTLGSAASASTVDVTLLLGARTTKVNLTRIASKVTFAGGTGAALAELHIVGGTLSALPAALATAAPNLQVLDLRDNAVTSAAGAPMDLARLSLDGNNLASIDVAALVQPGLGFLSLSRNAFPAATVVDLRPLLAPTVAQLELILAEDGASAATENVAAIRFRCGAVLPRTVVYRGAPGAAVVQLRVAGLCRCQPAGALVDTTMADCPAVATRTSTVWRRTAMPTSVPPTRTLSVAITASATASRESSASLPLPATASRSGSDAFVAATLAVNPPDFPVGAFRDGADSAGRVVAVSVASGTDRFGDVTLCRVAIAGSNNTAWLPAWRGAPAVVRQSGAMLHVTLPPLAAGSELPVRSDIRLVVSPLCFAGRSDVDPITVGLVPPPPPLKTVVEPAAQTVATVATAVSAFSGSPTGAVVVARTALVANIAACDRKLDTELSANDNPTRGAIGDTPVRYFAGAAVYNCALLLAFGAAQLAVAAARKCATGEGCAACLSWVRFPSLTLFPLLYLLQPTATAAFALVISGTGATLMVVGLVVAAALLACGGAIYLGIFRAFGAKFVRNDLAAMRLESEEAAALSGETAAHRRWRRATFLVFAALGEWVDRGGATTRAGSPSPCSWAPAAAKRLPTRRRPAPPPSCVATSSSSRTTRTASRPSSSSRRRSASPWG
jgi:hypothetical protein